MYAAASSTVIRFADELLCIILITTIEATFDGFAQQLDWREFEVAHAGALDLLLVITLEF